MSADDRMAERAGASDNAGNAEGSAFFPLTHPQKRIGYVEQRYADTSLHVVGCTTIFDGAVDLDRLARAIRRFVAERDAFRLAFAHTPEGLRQMLRTSPPPYAIPLVDLSDEPDPDAALERFVSRGAAEPMQVGDEALFAFALFRLDGGRCGYTYRFHHIIADGWSVQLMSEAIAGFYEAESGRAEGGSAESGMAFDGSEAGVAAGARSESAAGGGYLRLLERERRYADSARFARDRRFWLEQFAELPEPLYPAAEDGLAGARHVFRLDPATGAALRQYADERGMSLHAVFTALLLMLLHRDSGADDLVVGVPVYNRTDAEEKRLFGMFTSTMPLRVRAAGDMTADAFVARVQERLRVCFLHQKYPYDLLAQDLELRRRGRDGLFEATVNVYNTRPRDRLDGRLARTHELYAGCQLNPLDIVVHEWAEAGVFTVELKYRRSCFDAERIAAMAEALQALLGGLLADGGCRLAALPLTTGARTGRLLAAFNRTERQYAAGMTLYELFAAQADRTPERIAVECGGRAVSYRGLRERADAVAERLRGLGAGPGAIVGMMAERSPLLLAGIYGILKTGAAYLPLDPSHPPERISYSLADSGAGWLLVSAAMRERGERLEEVAANDGPLLVELEAAAGEAASEGRGSAPTDPGASARDVSPDAPVASARDASPVVSDPTAPAYLIYTSGSTGKPKGVVIPHSAAVNYVEAMAEALPWPAAPVVLGVTTVSFDIFVTESLLPLSKGMRIVLADEEELTDADRLRALIADSGVNVVQMTPSRMQLLLGEGGPEATAFLAGAETVMLGGEPLPPLLLARLRELTDARIFNMYGPTETTVWSTLREVTGDRRITVGRPLANTQVLILDRRGEPLPVGMAGELCIAGAGLALGYRGRDELTAQAFAAHPLADGRLYRTGDLARWLPDGTIEHLGRLDRQIKVRGYRIEPGEIESCLLSQDAISMAAVVDREDAAGIRELYAYYTASRPLTQAELRAYAARWLPAYMIPAAFAGLPALPLTPSGKIDRRALAELSPPGAGSGPAPAGGPGSAGLHRAAGARAAAAAEAAATATVAAPPAAASADPAALRFSDEPGDTALERTIAACLSSLLPGEPLGPDASFFASGGHSLHVLRAVALLKERDIPARASDLYAEPTPAGLAALLRRRHGRFAFQAAAEPETLRTSAPAPIRVLGGVAPNRDAFAWEQINCFTKPMAILFEALSPGSFELFLLHVQFGLTFFPDDWKQDVFARSSEPHADFFTLYEFSLKPLFGVDIERQSFTSEAELRALLLQSIDRGCPALVPGDLFGLYYSHHYLSEPHVHYFIVKGYDAKRDLVYVLDNMHIDDGARPVYRDYVVRFGELYEMSRLYAANWCADGAAPHLWSLARQQDRLVTRAAALELHRRQLERAVRGAPELRYLEREIAIEVETRQDAGRFAAAIPLMNYRSTYFELLFGLLEQAGSAAADIAALRARRGRLSGAWEPLRLALLDRIGERVYRFGDLMPRFEELAAEERAFFEEALALLVAAESAGEARSEDEAGIVLKEAGRLRLYNPNGAVVKQDGELVRMEHTVARIDDTWIVKDEAPQLLLTPAEPVFAFEAAALSDGRFDGCYHSGIIVKFRTKGKLLFGCARRKLLGVFYPERTDNYELYARPEVDAVHGLRVEATDGGRLRFLARHDPAEPWETLLELTSPDEIVAVGLFSKTWEPTDHATEFSNVKYMPGVRTAAAADAGRGDRQDGE